MRNAKEGDWKPAKCDLLIGDCRDMLKTIPDKSIHCCVTSPPYWGLRDYKVSDQIGQEKTPEMFVENMLSVFREVKRVLRDDGTLWLNLGDTTVNKQLQGIPWRVAFALQADGWFLRQDIIWAKPSPMPESVTDRCTKAHEYIFLMTKSARYFYDAEAVKEEAETGGERGLGFYPRRALAMGREASENEANNPSEGIRPLFRNKRSVWTISGKPYKGAHFATFPPDLIEPCILAGTSAEGCCKICGAPWERVVDGKMYTPESAVEGQRRVDDSRNDKTRKLNGKSPEWKSSAASKKTVGWQPTCQCNTTEKSRCVVLDPFNGSGTTGEVARMNGCDYIGCELNPEYAKLSRDRWDQGVLL
jgi:DNA modification methylase